MHKDHFILPLRSALVENPPKALETTYKGYRCRSRLEARWLVFFDKMGIRFEYETEGFKIEDGAGYLPDLWLPDFKWWAEVKPTFWKTEEENRAFALVRALKQGVLLLDGPPDFHAYFGFSPAPLADGSIQAVSCDYSLDIYEHHTAEQRRFWGCPDLSGCTTQEAAEPRFSEHYRHAVYASRGERFYQ